MFWSHSLPLFPLLPTLTLSSSQKVCIATFMSFCFFFFFVAHWGHPGRDGCIAVHWLNPSSLNSHLGRIDLLQPLPPKYDQMCTGSDLCTSYVSDQCDCQRWVTRLHRAQRMLLHILLPVFRLFSSLFPLSLFHHLSPAKSQESHAVNPRPSHSSPSPWRVLLMTIVISLKLIINPIRSQWEMCEAEPGTMNLGQSFESWPVHHCSRVHTGTVRRFESIPAIITSPQPSCPTLGSASLWSLSKTEHLLAFYLTCFICMEDCEMHHPLAQHFTRKINITSLNKHIDLCN